MAGVTPVQNLSTGFEGSPGWGWAQGEPRWRARLNGGKQGVQACTERVCIGKSADPSVVVGFAHAPSASGSLQSAAGHTPRWGVPLMHLLLMVAALARGQDYAVDLLAAIPYAAGVV